MLMKNIVIIVIVNEEYSSNNSNKYKRCINSGL